MLASDWSQCSQEPGLDLVQGGAGAADVQAHLGADHGGLVQQLSQPHLMQNRLYVQYMCTVYSTASPV